MKKILAYIIVPLIITEIVLRIIGFANTYSEDTKGEFTTYLGSHESTWFHIWTPNETVNYSQPEFTFVNHINSKGVREKNIQPQDTCMKYLFLGDSFTEGDGTPYETSMPRYFEKLVADSNCPMKAYNAGVCGSDPLFSYMFYKYQLDSFAFKEVFLVLNNGERNDIFVRGGFERFKADSTTQFKNKTWHTYLFAASRIFRTLSKIAGYDENRMKMTSDYEYYKPQYQLIGQAIDSINYLCNQRGAKLNLVFFPFPQAVLYNLENKQALEMLKYIDTSGINIINLNLDFSKVLNEENLHQYSWKINGHYNAEGYHLFADLLYAKWSKNNLAGKN